MQSPLLNRLEFFGIKLGLEQIGRLLEHMGHPERTLRFIHVAGTNGKGSVCALCEASLRARGLKTGLYCSPHLRRVNERFRINGKVVDDEVLEPIFASLEKVVAVCEHEGLHPTFFEVTTAAAIALFAHEKCDIVLWETGMGGRFDATNVMTPLCSVITSISLDHCQYLGDTLLKIASEKAGIIKSNTPIVYTTLQQPDVQALFAERAAELHAPCYAVTPPQTSEILYRDGNAYAQKFEIDNAPVTLSLLGTFQLQNAALAYTVLRLVQPLLHLPDAVDVRAWEHVRWEARFDTYGALIIDGAHNPDAARMLRKTFMQCYPGEKATLLFANFADKNTPEILAELVPIAFRFILTQIEGAKGRPSLDPEALTALIHTFAPDMPVHCEEHTARACAELLRCPGRLLCCGSLYLAGAMLAVLDER